LEVMRLSSLFICYNLFIELKERGNDGYANVI
jgi:hypothetical protein